MALLVDIEKTLGRFHLSVQFQAEDGVLALLGASGIPPITGLEFSYDAEKVAAAVSETYGMDGIYYVRTWLNQGRLQVGDDIMYVMIGGDIRPHVIEALQYLVGKIKRECVTEREICGEAGSRI